MPSLFVHQLLAEKILSALPKGAQAHVELRKEAYFLGAQGGDPFYLYSVKEDGEKKNVGVLMHKHNISGQFSAWVDAARTDNATAYAYALGYVTHYAVDTVFHPYICYRTALAEQKKDGRKRDNRHFRIESDIDCLFVEKYLKKMVNKYRYPNPRKGLCAAELSWAFASVAKDSWGIKIRRKPLMRAVNLFLRLQTFLQDRLFWRRKWVSGVETLLCLNRTPSCMIRRKKPDRSLENAEHAIWYYPEAPEIVLSDDVWQLAEKAVARGQALAIAFDEAVQNGTPLDANAFGLHFVSGLPA